MVYIELRKDKWFEAGKDEKYTMFAYAYVMYGAKQELKKSLEGVGEKKSIKDLETELSNIVVPRFKGSPYLEGDYIYINTHGLPGRCYLGEVKE